MPRSRLLKLCLDCGATRGPLPLDEFHKNKRSGDGRADYCKACACARRRRCYNPDYERAYRAAHADERRRYMRVYMSSYRARQREKT